MKLKLKIIQKTQEILKGTTIIKLRVLSGGNYMMKLVSAILIAFMLASCMGDATLFVRGKIIDERGSPLDGCDLVLTLASDDLEVDRVKIKSVFRQDFVVSPRKTDYRLIVDCDLGLSTHVAKFSYPDDQGDDVDLGDITIKRMAGDSMVN